MFQKLNLKLLILTGFILLSSIAFSQTTADSVIIVQTVWNTDTLQKGIVHKQAQIENLYGVKQNINIIEIDRKKSRLKAGIAVNLPNEVTSKTALLHNAEVAINGSFYNMQKGYSVCYLQLGKERIDSTSNSEWGLRTSGIIRIKRGKLKIESWSKEREQHHKLKREDILASGPLLIMNNEVCDFTPFSKSFVETKHPRTAIATTKDKKIILLTVDGRFPGKAEGISIPELAHLLKVLGATDALNLDGGGSTTMWHRHAPENGVVNKTLGNKIFDNWGERKIANVVYFYKN